MIGANNTILPESRLLSYDSAFKKWKAIKPIRGRSDQNTRPLGRRGNDNMTIRQEECSGDIVVRLYSTDVIRYRSYGDGNNNLIELEPYASSLTTRFVWSLLGPHVSPMWSDRDYPAPDNITEVNGRYYHTPDHLVVQPKETGWELVGGAVPFEVPYLNRKEGKQALKEAGYYTFKLWLETKIRLGVAEFGRRYNINPYGWSGKEALGYLSQGEKGWAEITARMSNAVPVETELRALREAVYQYETCYDTQTIPYFETYQQVQNAISQIRKHG
jgi:hypothetical protein